MAKYYPPTTTPMESNIVCVNGECPVKAQCRLWLDFIKHRDTLPPSKSVFHGSCAEQCVLYTPI